MVMSSERFFVVSKAFLNIVSVFASNRQHPSMSFRLPGKPSILGQRRAPSGSFHRDSSSDAAPWQSHVGLHSARLGLGPSRYLKSKKPIAPSRAERDR